MPQFNDPAEVEMICYQMKLADFPRGLNRARINDLFNGVPPYTEEEVQRNNIAINTNSLEGTRVAHDARSQFYGAFLKPGNYFKATTDMGPVHKRQERSTVVTKEINKIMKHSLDYFECFRSKFASDVLHGIGPSVFDDQWKWCPEPAGIEDVMAPANTLLTMKNLPFLAKYRSYTAPELIRLTRGPKVDPAWNKELVDSCIEWIDRETMQLIGSNWPEVWSPEKASERVKGDGGFYVGDQVPTIDVWDFYFWNDDGRESGWQRRMILDSWSTPQAAGGVYSMSRKTGDIYHKSQGFLYNSKKRKFASKLTEIINFQFADLSAVAPFRYHSVRSLGFLMYSVCHLQNRLRCKFNESVFESLMMYFRVKSMEDVQRVLKVELFNRGFIDDTVQFVPAAERFQVPAALVQLGIQENSGLIQKNSSSYTTINQGQDNKEKTRFQAMAELQTATALVSAALLQAYHYQTPEYREIFRRFCKDNSPDVDVMKFQAACQRQGVPKSLLNPEAWEIEPERVMGGGNKTLEMTIAEQLMAYRNLYDPEPQRQILRDVTLAITDDPARANALVPEQPQISDSMHDAQLRFGTLMQGGTVTPKGGVNHREVIEALLVSMATVVNQIKQSGNMTTMDKVTGLANVGQNISQEIQMLSADKNEKQRVKQYGDVLGKLMNEVKGFAQRLQEQAKQQAASGGGLDPKDQAKIQGQVLMAKVKADNTSKSHAQRTAQRQLQFEQQIQQDKARHELELQVKAAEAQIELTASRLKSLNNGHEDKN